MRKQTNFTQRICYLLALKKSWRTRLSSQFILLLIFSLSLTSYSSTKTQSLSSKYSLTKEEKTALQEFFRDLLFKHPGAYTLFGTKPITTACIYEPLTEEEKKQQQAYLQSLSPEEKKTIRPRKYDFEANFNTWQAIRKRLPITQYLFGVFPAPCEGKTSILFFVNIEMTLRTFVKHYEDFRRVLGYDFDPFQVVFEVENGDSKFWRGVLSSHALQGILLGMGQENSWFFEWERKYDKQQTPMGSFIRALPSSFYEEPDQDNPDPQHFLLPIFRSFGKHSNNQLIEKYKKEREQIRQIYKGQDEVEVALAWLTNSASFK